MARSFIDRAGDGSTTLFPFSFDYLDRAHIAVFVDGSPVSFSFTTDYTIQLATAPAAGTTVRVKRTTPKTPVVDFKDGETLTESDLDKVTLQSLYLAEESDDSLTEVIKQDGDGKYDALNAQIKNVADPQSPQDAATKAYVDTGVNSGVVRAETAATNAENSAITAGSHQAAANTAKGHAETAQAAAEAAQSGAETAQSGAAADRAATQAHRNAAEAAQTAAESARADAQTGAASASNDAGRATTAAQSATTQAANASSSAVTAQSHMNAANTAKEAAQAARTASETAQGASEAAQAAAETAQTNAAGSAATAGSHKNAAEAAQAAAEAARDAAGSHSSTASGHASAADTARIAAETAEGNAASSEAAAAASATAIAGAESQTLDYRNAAQTARDQAQTAQGAAETAETNAKSSETAAAGSASAAQGDAAAAGTSEANSVAARNLAIAARDAAQTAQAAAEAAQTAATNAKNATEALFDGFDDKFLGSKATPPTLDNDGQALLQGALYWDTAIKRLRIYNGSDWENTADGALTAADMLAMVKTADGAGSGLDADLLDGYHANAFARLGTNNTFTGRLEVDTGSSSDAVTIRGTTPTISILDDTADAQDFYIHVNNGQFYVLVNREGENVVGGGWEASHPLQLNSLNSTGYLFGQRVFAENYHPNADKLTTGRSITLSGDVSGTVSFDGSQNVNLVASVANNSHTHTIANIDGLQAAIDAKFSSSGGMLSGPLRFEAGHGRGIEFWQSSSYSIYMSSVAASASLGGRLDSTSDYNMYFRMSGNAYRGFVFKNGDTPVAHITGQGVVYASKIAGTWVATPAEAQAGVANDKVMTPKLVKDALNKAPVTYSSPSANLTLDFAAGNCFEITLDKDVTLAAPANATAGMRGQLLITQGGAGGNVSSFAGAWYFGFTATLTPAAEVGSQVTLHYYVDAAGHVNIYPDYSSQYTAGGRPADVTLVAAVSVTTHEVTVPTTVKAGDLLVYNSGHTGGSGTANSAGTDLMQNGWSLIISQGASGWSTAYFMYAKVATAADAGATYTTRNGSVDGGQLRCFRGPKRWTGFTPLQSSTLTNNNPSSRSVTPTGTGDTVAVNAVGTEGKNAPFAYSSHIMEGYIVGNPTTSSWRTFLQGEPVTTLYSDARDNGNDNYAGVASFDLIREP